MRVEGSVSGDYLVLPAGLVDVGRCVGYELDGSLRVEPCDVVNGLLLVHILEFGEGFGCGLLGGLPWVQGPKLVKKYTSILLLVLYLNLIFSYLI